MQKANDITTLAIQAGIAALTEGCNPRQISQKIAQKHTELGAQHGFASVTFGVATSFPHGSSRKQILQKGDVVMLDCGCQVDGYESDITRTVILVSLLINKSIFGIWRKEPNKPDSRPRF